MCPGGTEGIETMNPRFSVRGLLVSDFVAGSFPLSNAYWHSSLGQLVSPTAHAKSRVRSPLDRVAQHTLALLSARNASRPA
jgi:hypothetical protein